MEKKNSQNPLFFTFFSHFLMNKYYPLKTFKKVLRYTVLYFYFLYYSLVATTVLSLQPPRCFLPCPTAQRALHVGFTVNKVLPPSPYPSSVPQQVLESEESCLVGSPSLTQ